MKTETIQIWKEEYSYGASYGFIPKITTYIHEDDRVRPGILIVPGGGYCVVSPTEGSSVARRFYGKGYQTFVLTYTTNLLQNDPLKTQPLQDISRAIRYIRLQAEAFRVKEDSVAVCGFSAGGHLCASLCVHWEDIHDAREEYERISNWPDAAVLCYPVLTSGEKAHRDSFRALLGENASKEDLEYMSVEKYVTDQTSPAFIWATVTDDLVAVENSMMYAEACREKKVPYALHLFSEGQHGLADEEWASGEGQELYTLEQTMNVIKMLEENGTTLPEEFREAMENGKADAQKRMPNEEVAVWPELADQLNSFVNIQYDSRLGFPESDAAAAGTREKGTTRDPVMKWGYEANNMLNALNGSAAVADGSIVIWMHTPALGTSDYIFFTFSHETAHNQDGRYFYGGAGRRKGTGGEAHADGNIAQEMRDGCMVSMTSGLR